MKVQMTIACAACLALAGCKSGDNFDRSTQYGPNPSLPEPSRTLLPRMAVPKGVGWSQGEKPSVPQGFRSEALASGLSNPRNVIRFPTAICW